LNKTPKLVDINVTKDIFIKELASVPSNLIETDISFIWNNIENKNFDLDIDKSSLVASGITSTLKYLEENSIGPESLTLLLKGLGFILRHPRIASAVSMSNHGHFLYFSILIIFTKHDTISVREAVLEFSLSLFSCYTSSQLSSSITYPLSESTPSPLNQLSQIILVSLCNVSLKSNAIKLAFNLMLHLNQSGLLSKKLKSLILNHFYPNYSEKMIVDFFELEDGELWAMEFFSTLTQSLSDSVDPIFITDLVETLVVAQSRLYLTSSRTTIPALAQSLNFDEVLNQKLQKLEFDDKTRVFLNEASKFISDSN